MQRNSENNIFCFGNKKCILQSAIEKVKNSTIINIKIKNIYNFSLKIMFCTMNIKVCKKIISTNAENYRDNKC